MLALAPTTGYLIVGLFGVFTGLAATLLTVRAGKETAKVSQQANQVSADQAATRTAVEAQASLIDDQREEIDQLRAQRSEDRAEARSLAEAVNARIERLEEKLAEARSHYERCDDERSLLIRRVADLEGLS